MTAPVIVRFRRDLRLRDNPALARAVGSGHPVLPLFIWSPGEEAPWAPGAASRWWLHQSLRALDGSLRAAGSRLVLRRGPASAALSALRRDTGATTVLENPLDSLLFDSSQVKTRAGAPFQVFTPYWRACLEMPPPRAPEPAPKKIPAPLRWPDSDDLDRWALEPRVDWAAGFHQAWTPGERGAQAALRRFRAGGRGYDRRRDVPSDAGTSRLSPHLHFGEISPNDVWHGLEADAALDPAATRAFRRELGWRDFAHALLAHFPETSEAPLRAAFARFPWEKDPARLRAWKTGRTGYPIVDAGMRELWATGWMHNRVRMIAASFLVKHLLISWREGAAWFWDTLVDADLANNTFNWQWAAGCGADAAPFFRIFNPSLQGEKFDPDGTYVRRWVPELERVDARWIHRPWAAPPGELAKAGVTLGRTYPVPVIDHAAARDRALAAFRRHRSRARAG